MPTTDITIMVIIAMPIVTTIAITATVITVISTAYTLRSVNV